jgi:hypothetical protein
MRFFGLNLSFCHHMQGHTSSFKLVTSALRQIVVQIEFGNGSFVYVDSCQDFSCPYFGTMEHSYFLQVTITMTHVKDLPWLLVPLLYALPRPTPPLHMSLVL